MSADTLHEAARLMRERAEAATPQPWVTHEEHGRDFTGEGWSEVGVKALGVTIAYTAAMGLEDNDDPQADAAHIASWHPAVALAVADWLDHEADAYEQHRVGATTRDLRVAPSLAVARAYLNTGGASDAAL